MTSVVTSIHNFKQESLFRIKACRCVAFCEAGSSLAPLHLSRTLYKSPLFMQNKPNFQKSQMNVSILSKMDYENKSNWTLGENKPNSNPISSKAKMNANVFITKDYENETAFRPKKTNPNKANPDLLARSISNKSKVPTNCSLTERKGFYIMVFDRIINKAFAEVTGAWWCPWSSKPVWG